MDEKEAIRLIRFYIEKQFPKTCSCGKRYETLKDFVLNTKHVGEPASYDAEVKRWKPIKPIGTVSYSMCSCKSTITVNSSSFPILVIWRLMNWSRKESKKRGIPFRELLNYIRTKIDEQVLSEK